jgi:hypothetical protein
VLEEEGEEHGVLLGLGHNHALARPALAPLGLDGEVVKGPAIRIVGKAKRCRLADLIGEGPARVPREAWPVPSHPPAPPSAAGVRQHVVRQRRPADGNVFDLWRLEESDLPEAEERGAKRKALGSLDVDRSASG